MRPKGVVFLDHTADVGIEVRAESLEELFRRAALGTLALLRGQEDGGGEGAGRGAGRGPGSGPGTTYYLDLQATGLPELLADWLREILFLHEVRRLDYAGADFEVLDERRLKAGVTLEPRRRPVREIKGVTYHQLAAERRDGEWHARVIFDV